MSRILSTLRTRRDAYFARRKEAFDALTPKRQQVVKGLLGAGSIIVCLELPVLWLSFTVLEEWGSMLELALLVPVISIVVSVSWLLRDPPRSVRSLQASGSDRPH